MFWCLGMGAQRWDGSQYLYLHGHERVFVTRRGELSTREWVEWVEWMGEIKIKAPADEASMRR
jgi:hypothetical protein